MQRTHFFVGEGEGGGELRSAADGQGGTQAARAADLLRGRRGKEECSSLAHTICDTPVQISFRLIISEISVSHKHSTENLKAFTEPIPIIFGKSSTCFCATNSHILQAILLNILRKQWYCVLCRIRHEMQTLLVEHVTYVNLQTKHQATFQLMSSNS